MSRLPPRTTLSILLSAAAMLLLLGSIIARREAHLPLDRDRKPTRRFADDLQHELHRLERLYDTRLTRIARSVPLNDRQAVWAACDEVVGLRQCSLIHPRADATLDWHLPIESPRDVPWPAPAFFTVPGGIPRPTVTLAEADLQQAPDDSGWIDEPGKPLLFWFRRSPSEFIVLLIDGDAVAAAFGTWLQDWLPANFAPLRAAGGPDWLFDPSGIVASRTEASALSRPDLILPVRTRFGEWQLASADRYRTEVSYHLPTLATSAAVAVVIAVVGLLAYYQQRAALRAAEDRVSFVNAVSHELRAPLTNILLNSELARESLGTDDGEADRRIGLVREEAGRLSRLIENVLTFAGRRPAAPATQVCAPSSLVRSAVAQFLPSFTRRGISVEYASQFDEPLLLDTDAIAQVVSNLLSNVEKYADGAPVRIDVAYTTGKLEIVVADRGPGIAPADAERIFQPFERIDTRVNTGTSGTGLGLAISRDLARRMGGELRLLPAEHGAAFLLSVPAPLATPPQALAS